MLFKYKKDTDNHISYNRIHRPCLDGSRVVLSELQNYCTSHRMLGPCCLCPMIDVDQPDFVEAAMYMPSSGPFAGQYIAMCARDRCEYFGKLMTTIGI